MIILENAVGREKRVVSIEVHGVEKNGVVTLLVMSHFSHSQVPQGVPLLFVIQLRFLGLCVNCPHVYCIQPENNHDQGPPPCLQDK
jgi:hypothetical protein